MNTSEIDTLVTQVKIESSVDELSHMSLPSQKDWPIKSISLLFTDKGADMDFVENKIVPIYTDVVPERHKALSIKIFWCFWKKK